VEHSWASWGHVVVLVFFDSEKVGFCFVVSNFLSPFPFEVFFLSSLSVILEGWGGGGGTSRGRSLFQICFVGFLSHRPVLRGSPPPPAGGGGTLFPPPPRHPARVFTMLVLNLAKNRSSNITLLWMGVLRCTVVVHMLGSEQRFLSPQQFSLCDTSM
jgi:hypothetical protein